jgi:hypothetical protein
MSKQRRVRERPRRAIGAESQTLDPRAMQVQELGQTPVTTAHLESCGREPCLAFNPDLGEADLARERVLCVPLVRDHEVRH